MRAQRSLTEMLYSAAGLLIVWGAKTLFKLALIGIWKLIRHPRSTVTAAAVAGLVVESQLWIGVGLGALSAAGGAVVGNKTRAFLNRRTGWPDPWFGVLEDVVAIILGVWAVL